MRASLLATAACLLALALPPTAGAQTLPERIRSAGALRIATYPNYPPLTFRDPATNERKGFDVELGEAIAKQLGTKVDWQEMPFVQFIPGLQTGRIDLALDGIGDLPARRSAVDFVDYLRVGANFFTSASSKEINQPTDLCGKRVGASRSTSWPNDIAAWSKTNCEAAGKPAIQVVGTEGSIDTRTQLRTGRLDGGVQGAETMTWLTQTEPGVYKPLGTAFTHVFAGIPVAKDQTELRDAVLGAVQALIDNGQYAAMLKKWQMDGLAVEKASINGAP